MIVLLAAGLTVSFGCEEPREELPSAEHTPNIPREPGPRFPQTDEASESMPVRTKVVSDGPPNTITLGAFRGGGGGGGGGDRVRGRPPGYPRGMRQEPEDQYAASRDAVGQRRRRGSEACELAYEAARDLQRARQSKTAGRGGAIDRDDFIETCELRPEIEQWCLVPSYVMQNSGECDRRAHTRYARAIERYENRAEGEADDWAPTEAPPEASAEAEAPEAPTMGPVRLNPP